MPTISIEISEELEQSVRKAAAWEGLTVEAWAAKRIRASAPTAADHARSVEHILSAVARIEAEREAQGMGRQDNSFNEAIDADLAREYADTHDVPA